MDDAHGRDGPQYQPGTLVDFGRLEQELARLWQPEESGQSVSSGLATRLSVLNLVIYAWDTETSARARNVAERLSSMHPCRAIMFSSVDQIDRHDIIPEVYATCQRDEEGSQAPCIELINIPVLSDTMGHIRSLIEPAVLPGLPVFVWWPGSPPLDDPGVRAVAEVSDRFVVDSLSFASVRRLSVLENLGRGLPACVLTDLNWQRLQPWRELTAQYFDIRNVQWALGHIREVEIEAGQADNEEIPSQTLFFAAWLIHCLSWTVTDVRRVRRDRWFIGVEDRRKQPIRMMIRTRPTTSEYSGHMLSLSMVARDDSGRSSSLSLSHGRRTELIRMHAKSGFDTELHHAVHHSVLTEEALLVHVLETTDRDHVFDETLTHAVGILQKLERPVVE
jgi:glucose-6-phosphate dehydrogenase assembly protein OpcA